MARTRYRWNVEENRLEEIGADYHIPVRGQINVDRQYENLGLQDGTVVNSRRQHREYMKQKGVTLADDFKGTWAKAAEERKKIASGDFDHKARREAVGRAAYQLRKP